MQPLPLEHSEKSACTPLDAIMTEAVLAQTAMTGEMHAPADMLDYSALLAQVYTVVFTLAVVALVSGVRHWFQDRTAATPDPTLGEGSGDIKAARPDDAKDASTPTDSTQTTKPASDATDSQGGGADGKPSDKTEDKPKEDKAPTRSAPAPNAVTPQSLQAEVQSCHRDIKALALALSKYMDDVPERGTQHASALQGVKEQVTDMSNAMKQLKHDVVSINGDTKLLAQRVTGVEAILGQLAPKLSTLVGSVGTLSTNLDTVRQTLDGHWKDSAKTLQALGANLKANHAHWEQTTEKNQQYLVEGVKEVLKKVTTCDYESFTGLTKQVEQLGQEMLAALGFLQQESGAIKDGLYGLAQAAASTSEQVAIVKEYCERPPVPVHAHFDRAPPPPSHEAPGVITERRQLHLQSAIPTASQALPPVYIDLGEGRKINIPIFK